MDSKVELIIENGGIETKRVKVSANDKIVLDTNVQQASQPLFYLRKKIRLPNGINRLKIEFQHENSVMIKYENIFVMKRQWVHIFIREYEEGYLPTYYNTSTHYMQPMMH